MQTPTPNGAPTPIDLFIDFLQAQTELPELTEQGTTAFRRYVRTALPFLPAIVLSGQWCDSTCNAIADAVSAIVASDEAEMPATWVCRCWAVNQREWETCGRCDRHSAEVFERNRDALYVVGLVVGLALANALNGMAGGMLMNDQYGDLKLETVRDRV
jgi:hypothetical protein